MLTMMNDAAKRAEWVYGQPMAPCPACGSYNMKPQIPIAYLPFFVVCEIS